MKTVIPSVPEEFAIKGDITPWTKLSLALQATYNPVPALTVVMEFLAAEGVEISNEVYDKVMQDTVFLAASPHWGQLVTNSFRQNGTGITANPEMVHAAHRAFIIKLVHNLRDAGHDIPAQSWETKSETEPLETKEES